MCVVGIAAFSGSCNSKDRAPAENTEAVGAALTPTQARILGFETPASDWSSSVTIGQSSTHSEGTVSLAVTNQSWTEITSVPLSSLGPVRRSFQYDIRLPAAVPWGQTRALLRIPSLGVDWTDLGGLPLPGLSPGVFHRVSFPVHPTLLAHLEGSYTDLQLRIVISAPTPSSPVLIDGIRLGQLPGPPDVQAFSVTLPQGSKPEDMLMSFTDRIQLDDQVVLGTPSELESVANLGGGGFELGSTGFLHANVYNNGGVAWFRSQSHVRGFVRSGGTIQKQLPVWIDGGEQPSTFTPSETLSWSIVWPDAAAPAVIVPQNEPPSAEPPLAIAPGAYGGLDIYANSRISLTSGRYYFDSFNTEPTSQVFVDTSSGPIFIYARHLFRYHGPFVQTAGAPGMVFVGYSGTANADLQVGFVGTIVAPNAKIDLKRPTVGQHRGAFFGARMQAFTNTGVLHIPFDWNFFCPLGDSDADGVNDCDDACPADPLKAQPGACGCNYPDADADADAIPDCIDGCKNDPTNAGCANDDALPDPVDLPPPSGETPVDPLNCNAPAGLPEPVPLSNPPTSAQLAAARAATNALADAPVTNGTACEPVQVLTDCALDPNHVEATLCGVGKDGPPDASDHAACATQFGPGFICNYGVPTATCLGVSPVPDECKTKEKHCGLPDPVCADLDPLAPLDPTVCVNPGDCPCSEPGNPACTCEQFDLCSPPTVTGDSGPSDVDAYDPITPGIPPAITSAAEPPPDPVYTDPVADPNCPKGISGGCWCKLGVHQPEMISEVQSKPADHGGGSLLSLSFDPNLQFDVDVRPLPFGESNFTADAAASFRATVGLNFPLFPPASTDIIDFAAGVHADRCSISTLGTRFMVLGVDFIDFSDAGSEPFDTKSDSNPQLKDASANCFLARTGFIEAADRAKKSLKDAQQLVEQYQDLAAGTTFDKTTLCAAAGTSTDPEFVNGLCSSEPAAATINRYIDYYNENRIPKLQQAMSELALKSATLVDALQVADSDSVVRFLDVDRNESVTIVRAQFFVGPIPVSITVDVGLTYGVKGDLFYRFSPLAALALPPGSSSAQLAAVGGKLVPSAGAMLEVFAGVGFDVPGFAVKAGISGELTLAVIQANLESGVGLSVASHEDARPIPSPLDVQGTGELFFPTRQHEYFIDWFYGASLGLPAVLQGTLNAKVKLKAFLFSKTFKKTILTFGPAFSLPETRLVEGGSQLGSINLPAPSGPSGSLGIFEMQTPLVRLRRLAVPATEPSTTVPFDVAELEQELHFNGVCNVPPIP